MIGFCEYCQTSGTVGKDVFEEERFDDQAIYIQWTNKGVNMMDKNITIGNKYGPAMTITDPIQAAKYFKECVRHTMIHGGKTRQEAEQIERANLGYYAGYYGIDVQERVENLFGGNCGINR